MKDCFYKEKSAIIITGATGIIGQALAKQFATNIQEDSTILLSSRSNFRLKALKEEILKLRPNIRVETVVWNLESPNYDIFYSDIKHAFSSNCLFNDDKVKNSRIPYYTALLIHNATDVGDIDKTVIEHGENPKRIQQVLNTNIVSLISLTSAFVKYFNIFKTKKIVVEMVSSSSKYPFPSFGHISLKCACKMVLDILLQEEDGKLKVLYYNPVAVDTENLRKIRDFTNDERIKEAFDILYKSKKLFNSHDVSKYLFDVVNNNRFHNGSIVNYGEEIDSNDEIDECFDITSQLKKYHLTESDVNENIVERHENQSISITSDNDSSNSELHRTQNYISNLKETFSKEIENISQEHCLPSNISKIEKYLDTMKRNSIDIIKNSQFEDFQEADRPVKDDIFTQSNNSNNMNSANKSYRYVKNKNIKENKNIKLHNTQKNINTFIKEDIRKDNTINNITLNDNFIRKPSSSNSKTSSCTSQEEIINDELSELEISKPKTFYQEYKEIYLKETLHSPTNVVVPNSSSFKIIKSLYSRNKSQDSDDLHKQNEIYANSREVKKQNIQKDTYKSTNKTLSEMDVLRNIKTDNIEEKDFSSKRYQYTRKLVEDDECGSKFKLGVSKESTVDKVIFRKNENITFLVRGTGQNKTYIINGVVYHIEGAYKHSNYLQ
uniref:Sepiapterin reductase n=1 Tax=Strongyloides papillosus TaxID=174720 RepID=A0A0N5B5T9_STREA